MIRVDKDPTLQALLRQQALAELGFYKGALDNWWGPKSEAAQAAWKATYLIGDGTWKWAARIDGCDIVIEDASMTWFGGDHDPLDTGETASGVMTKGNPDLLGIALPVVPGHPSTKGSPLAFGDPRSLSPGIPWRTGAVVSWADLIYTAQLIDNGPAKSAGDSIDGTVKLFTSLGGNLEDGVIKGVTVRLLNAAQYARA